MFGALALENGYGALALENRGRKKGKKTRKGAKTSRRTSGYKFGDYTKQSGARGAHLITTGTHQGRRVYKVRGHKGFFYKFGHAKSAANALAY